MTRQLKDVHYYPRGRGVVYEYEEVTCNHDFQFTKSVVNGKVRTIYENCSKCRQINWYTEQVE